MSAHIQESDGIFAEYGKTVFRFPRSIKEGMEGFANIEMSDEEHLASLDEMERRMAPLIWTLVILAALVVLSQWWVA